VGPKIALAGRRKLGLGRQTHIPALRLVSLFGEQTRIFSVFFVYSRFFLPIAELLAQFCHTRLQASVLISKLGGLGVQAEQGFIYGR
jgi:hypothetical protein